jgi:osmotically inducible lipoprotein OsmB
MSVMTRKLSVPTLLTALAIGLAGCGYTPGQRALSGGAIGAGTGAIIGAATGGSAATGALIGGGVGAIGGAVTTHNQVNLGN